MNKERPAGVIHVVAPAKIDVCQRFGDVDQTSRSDVQPKTAKAAAKRENVCNERHANGGRPPLSFPSVRGRPVSMSHSL